MQKGLRVWCWSFKCQMFVIDSRMCVDKNNVFCSSWGCIQLKRLLCKGAILYQNTMIRSNVCRRFERSVSDDWNRFFQGEFSRPYVGAHFHLQVFSSIYWCHALIQKGIKQRLRSSDTLMSNIFLHWAANAAWLYYFYVQHVPRSWDAKTCTS